MKLFIITCAAENLWFFATILCSKYLILNALEQESIPFRETVHTEIAALSELIYAVQMYVNGGFNNGRRLNMRFSKKMSDAKQVYYFYGVGLVRKAAKKI